MGYSIIEGRGNQFTIITIDVLKLSSKKDHYERLQLIHRKITELVDNFSPDQFAIEAPFFGKNVQSMLKLGRAQGVAIAAAMMHGLQPVEYAPRKIKQSITGKGNASKEKVWQMLQHTLKIEENPRFMDATDAVAVALCHHYQNRIPVPKEQRPVRVSAAKKKGSWEAFISANPERVR